MKNVDKLYKKYYNVYKSDYDNDDELTKDYDYKQFEIEGKISKKSKRDGKTKELKLTELPKWLISKNDFNEARKLIKILELIQIKSNQVLEMRKFLMI